MARAILLMAVLVLIACIAVPLVAAAQTSDVDANMRVTLTAGKGSAHGETLCSSSTPTLVGSLTVRRSIFLQNLGPNAVYICPDNSCTANDGIKLAQGDTWSSDIAAGIQLYCLAATADQVAGAGLRFIEVR